MDPFRNISSAQHADASGVIDDFTASVEQMGDPFEDAAWPLEEDAGAVSRAYSAEAGDTPKTIAKRYDALSRPHWVGELAAANPDRDWTARIYSGDVFTIPDAWPQPFWGAAKDRGYLDASGLAEDAGDPFLELRGRWRAL